MKEPPTQEEYELAEKELLIKKRGRLSSYAFSKALKELQRSHQEEFKELRGAIYNSLKNQLVITLKELLTVPPWEIKELASKHQRRKEVVRERRRFLKVWKIK